jgi:hypothetical protein
VRARKTTRKATALEGALVAAVGDQVVGPLRAAGLPVTAEDCLRLAHVVSVANEKRDLPPRPRQQAVTYLAWWVARWTATKTGDGNPYWPGVAAFMRSTGLNPGKEDLHFAGERLRVRVDYMLRRVARDVAGASDTRRKSTGRNPTGIAPRR